MPAKPKAIFFDLGGVLVKFKAAKIYENLSNALSLSADEVMRLATDSHHALSQNFELGLIDGKEFYKQVSQSIDLEIGYDTFKKAYVDIFTENLYVIRLAKYLKKYYPLFLLSNTTSWHFEFIRDKFKWMDLFTGLITSYQVGLLKPDQAIYQYALKFAQVNPAEALFIDDLLENITAARKIGMYGIHYRDNEDLIKQLKKLNIKLTQ